VAVAVAKDLMVGEPVEAVGVVDLMPAVVVEPVMADTPWTVLVLVLVPATVMVMELRETRQLPGRTLDPSRALRVLTTHQA
jgi:hypothetical protein